MNLAKIDVWLVDLRTYRQLWRRLKNRVKSRPAAEKSSTSLNPKLLTYDKPAARRNVSSRGVESAQWGCSCMSNLYHLLYRRWSEIRNPWSLPLEHEQVNAMNVAITKSFAGNIIRRSSNDVNAETRALSPRFTRLHCRFLVLKVKVTITGHCASRSSACWRVTNHNYSQYVGLCASYMHIQTTVSRYLSNRADVPVIQPLEVTTKI